MTALDWFFSSVITFFLCVALLISVLGLVHSWRCALSKTYRRRQEDVGPEMCVVWFSAIVGALLLWAVLV